MSQKLQLWIIAAVILGAIFITYSNHFHNDFHFDDAHTIEDNAYIRDLGNIPLFFKDVKTSSSMPTHQGYRPLVTTTLALNYDWSKKSTAGKNGYDTFWYHVSNFSWFVLIAFLIYFIQVAMFNKSLRYEWNKQLALLGCAWYGLNTVNAETINYIISRSDILSTLAIVGSFVLYIQFPKLRKYYLYVLPAVLGMFAKETTIMFAPALIAYDYMIEQERSLAEIFTAKGVKSLTGSIITGLPVLIVCVALAYMGMKMTTVIETYRTSLFWYVITQPYIMLHYVVQFFFPFGLTADTDLATITSLSDDRLFIGLAFLAGLVYLIFWGSAKKEWRPFAFGLVWFLLMLLPTSLVPLAEITNDHRPFLPNIGLVFSLMCAIRNLYYYVVGDKAVIKYGILAFLLLALVGYSYGSYQRNIVWKTDEALWRDVSEKSPHNGRGWMNYGLTLMARGDYKDAQYTYEQALLYTPRYYILHINIGVLKEALGLKAEAEQYYKNALAYGPGYVEPYYYYARYLYNQGRTAESEIYCNKGLEIFSGHIYSRYLLMDIYNYNKDWAKLKTTAQATLAMYPGDAKSDTYLKIAENPGSTIPVTGNKNLSASEMLNQSLALYYAGRYSECVAVCFRILEINPNSAEAYNNICTAYNQLQKYDSAVWACNKAVALKPDFQLAKNNLNWAKSQLKK
jgi:tetratricopeptide (TPR) repeat protein